MAGGTEQEVPLRAVSPPGEWPDVGQQHIHQAPVQQDHAGLRQAHGTKQQQEVSAVALGYVGRPVELVQYSVEGDNSNQPVFSTAADAGVNLLPCGLTPRPWSRGRFSSAAD